MVWIDCPSNVKVFGTGKVKMPIIVRNLCKTALKLKLLIPGEANDVNGSSEFNV